MPDDLAQDVVVWSDDCDTLFDEDDFNAPLFDSRATQESFESRGRQLAERVAQAVGDRFTVRYHGLDDRTWVELS